MTENQIGRREYVRRLLDTYRMTPGTSGYIRTTDRQFATALYENQIPLSAVEHALVLATARRLLRPTEAPRLGPVRSFYYFRAVIDEVMTSPVSEDYYRYLREKISSFVKTQSK